MADSHRILSTNVSKRPEDWVWINLHVKQFKNLPWSMTPLRFFFHREVPSAGNNNSLNVAGVKIRANADNIVFNSIHTSSFKMVVNFASTDPSQELSRAEKKGVNLYSIDTGMNGHPFMGHYFDMNADHVHGRLRKMNIGGDLENTKTSTLIIKP